MRRSAAGLHGLRGAARGDEPVPARRAPARQQRGQGGRFVAKERGQRLALPAHAVGGQPGGAVEAGLACGQLALAQQAAGGEGEARVEKPFGVPLQRAAQHGRGQGVHAPHVAFGAEVFEVDPDGAAGCRARRHERRKFGGDFAAERLDPDVGRRQSGQHARRQAGGPGQHADAVKAARPRARGQPGQRTQVVQPQAHGVAARRQLARQPPAHAYVAVVVDYLAENVPEQGVAGRALLACVFTRAIVPAPSPFFAACRPRRVTSCLASPVLTHDRRPCPAGAAGLHGHACARLLLEPLCPGVRDGITSRFSDFVKIVQLLAGPGATAA